MGSRVNSGRRPGLAWQYFTEIVTEVEDLNVKGKTIQQVKQRCKACGLLVSSRLARLQSHLTKCKSKAVESEGTELESQSPGPSKRRREPQTPTMSLLHGTDGSNSEEHLVESEQNISTGSQAQSLVNSLGRPSCASASGINITDISDLSASLTDIADTEVMRPPISRHASSMSQLSMSKYTCRTSSSEAGKLDTLCAEFFYANNIPFRVSESPQFKHFIHALRPGYKPPSRHELAGSLLETSYTKHRSQCLDNLKGRHVTYVEDGWSNIHNDPIIGSCLCSVGEKPIFLNAVDVGSDKKTSDYCTKVAIKDIESAKEKFQCTVTSCVTDNENKMVKMRDLLKEKYPEIVVYGCGAHWINLLERELIPDSIMKQVVQVQKYFRVHHEPHGWLSEIPGTKKPQLPNDTRWNSNKACLETFIHNHESYRLIAEEHHVERGICNILDNMGIFREAKNLLEQLKVLSTVLDKMQSDNTSIADAVHIWFDMLEHEKLQPYRREIETYMNKALTAAHYAAYMTHPIYTGAKLSLQQEEEARDWLTNRDPSFAAHLIYFEMKETKYFPKSMFSESILNSIEASKWWKRMSLTCQKNSDLSLEFCQAIESLHHMPASSASIERVFSSFGLIQTKLRNRLGNEKAQKLVYINRQIKANIQESYDEW